MLAFRNPKTIAELRQVCLKIEAGLADGNGKSRKPGASKEQPVLRTSVERSKRFDKPRQNSSRDQRSQNGSDERYRQKRSERARGRNDYSARSTERENPSSKEPRKPNGTYRRDNNQRPNTVQCYNCGKNGHYAKECWSRGTTSAASGKNTKADGRRNVNFVDSQDEGVEKSEVLTIKHDRKETRPKARFAVTEVNEERVNLLVGGGKLLKHKVFCNDVEINAVIDTGA